MGVPAKTQFAPNQLTQQEIDTIDAKWKQILAFAKKAFAAKPVAIAMRAVEKKLERSYNISNDNSGKIADVIADVLDKDYHPKSRAFQKVAPRTAQSYASVGSGYIPYGYPRMHRLGADKNA